MKNKKISTFIASLTILAFGFLFSDHAYADNASISKKWLLSQYANKCFSREVDTVTPKTNGSKVIDSVITDSTKDILMPSYSFNSISSTSVSCQQLLSGSGSLPSILDYYDSSLKTTKWNTSASAAEDLLVDVFDYSKKSQSNGGQFQIRATKTRCDKTDYSGNTECSTSEVQSKIITAELDENGKMVYRYDGIQWFNDIKIDFEDHNLVVTAGNFTATVPLYNDLQATYDEILAALDNKAGKTLDSTGNNATHTITTTYTFNVDDLIITGDSVSEYNKPSTVNQLIKLLNDDAASTKFETDELYSLYYYYLEKALPNSGQNYRMTCGEPSSTTGLTSIHLVDDSGAVNNCYVNFNGTDPGTISVNIIDTNSTTPTFKTGSMQDVVNWFNNLTIGTSLTNVQSVSTSESDSESEGSTDSSDDPCWNTDLDSMAWILCPAESNLEKTASTLDGVVQGWLEVDTDLYDSDSPTHSVWEIMRNIANIAMIIVLFVVIVSQLTGVGIDNYGIKKLLPKLILMAVLINLSFLICQLAVDLSNIFGVGLKNLFTAAANGIKDDAVAAGTWHVGENIFGGIIAAFLGLIGGVGSASGLIITGITIASGGTGTGMIIILLILMLLPIIAAILLFFLSLGARLLIVIICLASAPLAFVCYILPNTKNIYKSWWKLFESALIIFPICGALSGISYLLQVVLLASGEIHFAALIVALVAPYLVFFLLPSLLKKSIAGLGAIGGALTAMGGAFRKGSESLSRTAQNTERFKQAQEAGRANLNQRAIRRLENRGLNSSERAEKRKLDDKLRAGETLTEAEKTRYNELRKQGTAGLSQSQRAMLGQRTAMAEQFANRSGQLDRYAEQGAASVENAAYQTSYTSTGSSLNEKGGQSDTIKAYESQFGAGSAEKSRLAAAKGHSDQLSGVIANNRAAETFRTENAARGVLSGLNPNTNILEDAETTKIIAAAQNGTLNSVTEANGYSSLAAATAKRISGRLGDTLTGQDNQAILNQIRPDLGSGNAGLDAVIKAATQNKLSDVNSGNAYSAEQVALAQAMTNSGVMFDKKSAGEIMATIKGNGVLSTAAANLVNPDGITDAINASTSLSNIGITDQQMAQGIDTGTNKTLNNYEISAATNAAGEIRITHERAEALAQERVATARYKEHAEEFSSMPRGSVKDILSNIVTASGGDTMRVKAAMEDIIKKGGFEDLMSVVYKAQNIPAENQTVIDQYMATLTDPAAKQYGKYKAAGGTGTFREFIDGNAPELIIDGETKISSFQDYLATLDENGFNNATKDTIKFLIGQKAYKAVSPAQAANLAYAAKGEDRAAALKLLNGKIEEDAANRESIAKAYSDNQWSNMSLDLIQAITGTSGAQTIDDVNDVNVKALLGEVKKHIDLDQRLRNNLKSGVREFFKV